MIADEIREGLDVQSVGRNVICVDRCASTNDLAREAAGEGAPHGTVIFAEEQTSGRGRRGREWVASPGAAILCSFLLRPTLPVERIPLITVLGALAVTDVAEQFGVSSRVRFPNDVYVGGLKLAGILAESRFRSGRPDYIVLGVGLNVNGHPSLHPATSLGRECGRNLDRTEAARSLVEAVDLWTSRLEGPVDPFREAWRDRSDLVGCSVRILHEGHESRGRVLDVHCLEGVRLRLEGGEERLFRGEHIEKLEKT